MAAQTPSFNAIVQPIGQATGQTAV